MNTPENISALQPGPTAPTAAGGTQPAGPANAAAAGSARQAGADRRSCGGSQDAERLTLTDLPLDRIDLGQALQAKLGQKRLPRIALRAIAKATRIDDINRALEASHGKTGRDFLTHALDWLQIECDIRGVHNAPPPDSKVIFAGNHPLGGLDGIIILKQLSELYDDRIRAFVNDMLLYVTPIRHYFIPINKMGRQQRQLSDLTDRAYRSDCQLLTFPAGACSRKTDGKIQDLEWKKSFIQKAVEHRRDVVPIYFSGQNSAFFYRLAALRKQLRVKGNIEMAFLPSEMFKQRGKRFSLHIGRPISWQTFDSSRTPHEWAQWVREQCYGLSGK